MFVNEKEIYEAINSGNLAYESLNNALEKLDKAKGWGVFDILGGGFITSMIKRKRLREANQMIEQAKRNIRSFNKELGDVDAFDTLKIEVDDLLGIGDLIFDNIFFDLAMQAKIDNAIEDIHDAMDKIEKILDLLEERVK